MGRLRNRISRFYANLGPRYMPFTDVTSGDLTFAGLLRLSLFQVSVGITLVLLVGTLNRVMIVELGLPATVVGVMVALPLLFAPFRTLIGHRSDTHRSELGWRRVPFIWKGTLYQFGGFAIMPFALLVLAGRGEADNAPIWLGYCAAGLAFLLAGAGAHIVQTAGLALATDLTPQRSHHRVVGLMYVTLLLGMIASALIFGAILADFNPGTLIQLIQGVAVVCVVLNTIAVWKQEARDHRRRPGVGAPDPTFREAWSHFTNGAHAVRRLAIVGLGTMAFAMSEVLLEPYGGQVLNWTVASTTVLTALLAFGSLLGLLYGSYALNGNVNPFRMARLAAIVGIPALGLVILSAPLELDAAFVVANLMLGFGAALFGHATLTATMHSAPKEQAGLALGAWGAVQATAAGGAMALGAVIRDVVNAATGTPQAGQTGLASAYGYLTVYALEIVLLLVTIVAIVPLLRGSIAAAPGTATMPTQDAAGGEASKPRLDVQANHGNP
ncbi:MAG: PucC family protein [Pseudomonadota bacterium]